GIPFRALLPQAEFERVAPKHFLARIARPIHESVIDEHEPAIRRLSDSDKDRACLESNANPRLAFGERGLGPLTLDAERERVRDRAQSFQNVIAQRILGEHPEHTQNSVLDEEGITSEGYDSFADRPCPVAHTRVRLDAVG